MKIPSIPIPKPIRQAVLRRAVWDALRSELSYDQSKAVQAEAEARISAVLDDLMQPTTRTMRLNDAIDTPSRGAM